jgi:1-aminocyclopropane-1-carboxylate deaminase
MKQPPASADFGLLHRDLRLPSPVEPMSIDGRTVFVKRDDLLHPFFNGNKARKLAGWMAQDWSGIRRLVSWGGNQSNAMLALAGLSRLRGLPFVYQGKPLPDWLRRHPVGNYRQALALGMEYRQTERPDQIAARSGDLVLPRGLAGPQASFGFRQLAAEIVAFADSQGLAELDIFLPSGTGSSALFLQLALAETPGLRVLTCPCVGDARYLRQQFLELEADSAGHPLILDSGLSIPFGRPDSRLLAIWQELTRASSIPFDLVYDPIGWHCLRHNWSQLGGRLLYLHCGGLSGNDSMLGRYRRLGLT